MTVRRLLRVAVPFLVLALPLSAERMLTLVHTNDLHSQLLGFSPNIDYDPLGGGGDETVGGWARLAAVIRRVRQGRSNPVLALDAGDFLMGSLFHTIAREEAVELSLLKEMGYEAVTLGNHEFDLKPAGLARILEAASSRDRLPVVVASNLVFSRQQTEDDTLEAAFQRGLIRPFLVLDRGGLRVGLFGLVGRDAAEVAPFAAPVTFADPIETARAMVKRLREQEKAEVVICLSHGGLNKSRKKSEDELLAKEVPGIDVILSGHTHTRLPRPLMVGTTIIVQSWEYGRVAGVLDIAIGDKGVRLVSYDYVAIDDTIAGQGEIQAKIEAYERVIDERVLKDRGLRFFQPVVETSFSLTLADEECGLGNLLADSVRWAANRRVYDPQDPGSRVRVAIQSNGLIRSDIQKGRTGVVTVCDLFRTVPLGIGSDGSMAYPILSFYLYGAEIKKVMEVPTTIFPLKGSDYFLQLSGLKVRTNPRRMLFDRVTEILIEDEQGNYAPLDTSPNNKTLYRVAANLYNAAFIKIVGRFTRGLLAMVPKDGEGNPIEDLAAARVDAEPETPGLQELKDWTALIEYLRSFPDSNRDGIPNMAPRYQNPDGRYVAVASLNPYRLLKGAGVLSWIGLAAILLLASVGVLAVYLPLHWVLKRRKKR